MDELYMYVQVNTTVNSALRSGHLHVFISTCICRLPSLVNIYLVVRRVESDNRHIVLHHTLDVLQICEKKIRDILHHHHEYNFSVANL